MNGELNSTLNHSALAFNENCKVYTDIEPSYKRSLLNRKASASDCSELLKFETKYNIEGVHTTWALQQDYEKYEWKQGNHRVASGLHGGNTVCTPACMGAVLWFRPAGFSYQWPDHSGQQCRTSFYVICMVPSYTLMACCS